MKIVLAPDAFKGSLSAAEAAATMAAGIRDVMPDGELILRPLADGGEGTADALQGYLDSDCRLVESARLIGLNLASMRSLGIHDRGSALLGREIRRVLDAGCRRLLVALGGSATNDAGLGLLMALGVRALDAKGHEVAPTLAGLMRVQRLETGQLHPGIRDCRFRVLADVANPLLGPEGASRIYGPQKGLAADDIPAVEAAMCRFASLCEAAFGRNQCRSRPGAGAAGGLGFAFMMLGAEIESGADFVLRQTRFDQVLTGADWVITGEGRSDRQSLHGKLPVRVAAMARKHGVKAALLSGAVDADARALLEAVFDLVDGAASSDMPSCDAVSSAKPLLFKASRKLAGRLLHA